jgi:hypothetical protein
MVGLQALEQPSKLCVDPSPMIHALDVQLGSVPRRDTALPARGALRKRVRPHDLLRSQSGALVDKHAEVVAAQHDVARCACGGGPMAHALDRHVHLGFAAHGAEVGAFIREPALQRPDAHEVLTGNLVDAQRQAGRDPLLDHGLDLD